MANPVASMLNIPNVFLVGLICAEFLDCRISVGLSAQEAEYVHSDKAG
jgi:hypothetical protein